MTPVKEQALEYGIPVYQPLKVRDPAFVETVRQLAADVIVVVAFGQLIPKSILDMPKYGCVNIHASLLPKYRGAAPIQWAVIDGQAGERHHHHDDGRGPGHRRYAGEDRGCPG